VDKNAIFGAAEPAGVRIVCFRAKIPRQGETDCQGKTVFSLDVHEINAGQLVGT
jgi:hypothetical protein